MTGRLRTRVGSTAARSFASRAIRSSSPGGAENNSTPQSTAASKNKPTATPGSPRSMRRNVGSDVPSRLIELIELSGLIELIGLIELSGAKYVQWRDISHHSIPFRTTRLGWDPISH